MTLFQLKYSYVVLNNATLMMQLIFTQRVYTSDTLPWLLGIVVLIITHKFA